MNNKRFINFSHYNKLYYLCVKCLLGKLIKKGNKFKALKIYKKLKENIKQNINKEHEVLFVILLSLLKSMSKVSFKEIYLGSQKKELPMSVSEKKQVLVYVETLLKFSKNRKKLELDKLAEYISLGYRHKGKIVGFKIFKYKKAIENRSLLNILKPKKIFKKTYLNKNVSKEINN